MGADYFADKRRGQMADCGHDQASCACKTLTDGFTRRSMVTGTLGASLLGASTTWAGLKSEPVNLAKVALTSASAMSSETRLSALNDGQTPANSKDTSSGMYGNFPYTDTQWVQYDWHEPITTDRISVYWWVGGWHMDLPKSARLLYWDGHDFVPVKAKSELGIVKDSFNSLSFEPITTHKLRLETKSQGDLSNGILEWQVYNYGPVPNLTPVVIAGIDRSVVMGGQTYLNGHISALTAIPSHQINWRKVSGPGEVRFSHKNTDMTTAQFSAPGEYRLELKAQSRGKTNQSVLTVRAQPAPPPERLDVVYTKSYSLNNPLWNSRAKALIVNWIPHVIDYCERSDLKTGQGGIDNFIEAAKALRGEPHLPHKGYVFSNAWVLETVEAMSIALMIDPQGDAEIIASQTRMKATLERWIPIILAAQEPNGYLQTAYTLEDRAKWPKPWSPDHRGNHEGYIAGYFLECAINHYTMTNGQDLRLYKAAKRLADCWVAHIGPGKQAWFDGHQEMEQALVRFGRFINDVEGDGHGDAYIALAKFLLESRRGGQEYDQSHLPPEQQYEAVGHAVRAVYFYSGMADIAAETHNRDYQSAVASLWDNMVNRKYYVTGGVGSGETSEGFGGNYDLPNDAYCESCSSCGLIFFQYKMNLAYHEAKYADLYEQTLYNALLGSIDLEGKSYCYTNPLVNTDRSQWHVCPCCVSNLTRTLLMIPTWSYAKSKTGLYVNLYIGSRITVENLMGQDVEIVQQTDYPWNGKVAMVINPKTAKAFDLHLRIPNRQTSALYSSEPRLDGLLSLKINGQSVTPRIENGYCVLHREWHAGDHIEFELPMTPQRITADPKIKALRGQVALAYGPLIYCVEQADQTRLDQALGAEPLKAEWRSDLLDGVMVLKGQWADKSPLTAIPYYARMNRLSGPMTKGDDIGPLHGYSGLQSQVWIRS